MSSPLLIRSLGHIVVDKAFFARFSNRSVVFPDGVVIERAMLPTTAGEGDATRSTRGSLVLFTDDSGYDPSCLTGNHLVVPASTHVTTGLYFTGTVTRSPAQGPRFIITRSDDPVHKRYVSDKSATTALRAALDEACRDFPQQSAAIMPKDEKGKPLINGMRFYGLYLAEVAAQLRRRPNGAAAYAALEAEMEREYAHNTTLTSSQKTLPLTLVNKSETGCATPRRARSSATRGAERGSHSRSPASTRVRSSSRARIEQGDNNRNNAERTPCPQCGLTTAFCPLTGAAHYNDSNAVAATAQKTSVVEKGQPRRRGEVRLPRRPAKPRPRKSQQQHQQTNGLPAGEKSIADELHLEGLFIADDDHDDDDVAVVAAAEGTEAGQRRPSRRSKRTRPVDEGAEEQGRPRRGAGRRTATTTASTTSADKAGTNDGEQDGKTSGGTAGAETTQSEDVSIMDLIREEVMLHPPLRPPLSAEEQQKAAAVQQERWKAQTEQTLLPPPAVIAALRLPLVPVRRVHGGAAARRGNKGAKQDKRRRAKKGNGENATEEDNAHEEDDEDEEEAEGNKGNEESEDEAHAEGNNKAETGKAEGTTDEGAAVVKREPTMVHPLEITEFATSAAGKRYMKFMLQYTSERSRLELIKASQPSVTGPARGKTSRRTKKADEQASKVETAGQGEVKLEDGEAVTASPIENTLFTTSHAPAAAAAAAEMSGEGEAPGSPTVPAAATVSNGAA